MTPATLAALDRLEQHINLLVQPISGAVSELWMLKLADITLLLTLAVYTLLKAVRMRNTF